MSFEEDHLDLLQNLEFGIIRVFRQDPGVPDLDVMSAVQALARRYDMEDQHRTAPAASLGDRAQRIYDSVLGACEWRLGRSTPDSPFADFPQPQLSSPADLSQCLKRIRRSVDFWTRRDGRQGYLSFVNNHMD